MTERENYGEDRDATLCEEIARLRAGLVKTERDLYEFGVDWRGCVGGEEDNARFDAEIHGMRRVIHLTLGYDPGLISGDAKDTET